MNTFAGCGTNCGNNGWGNWIINLIIIIVAVEFLTQIFCGGCNRGGSCDNVCGPANCGC